MTRRIDSGIILVTGASGFLGSQIAYHLLEAGYSVRGTARPRKVSLLSKAFGRYGDQFQSVEVADVSKDDLAHVLQGVTALIHAAASLPGRTDAESALNGAIEGTTNVLRQAYQAGVRRVIITSSTVTFATPCGPFGTNDWNPIKREDASQNYWYTYQVAKTFADKAALHFQKNHSDLDLTFLGPSWTFGPFAPGFEEIAPEPDFNALSTNGYVYSLLKHTALATDFTSIPGYIDVRDVARAHEKALSAPKSNSPKRFPLVSPYPASYSGAIYLLQGERPHLRERLADPGIAPSWECMDWPVDRQRLEDVIGLEVDSYKTWKETVLDTIDSLVKLEEGWKSKGLEIQRPDGPPL
ncbi:hypothetical protein GYMLUDRAFT_67186 [Collybiopsis luxurians FD-317 M1]|nr:hypothetical protein GYMLUDRAFT_67186 [Collybiopsis luxurians FD-317 M1]